MSLKFLRDRQKGTIGPKGQKMSWFRRKKRFIGETVMDLDKYDKYLDKLDKYEDLRKKNRSWKKRDGT